MTKPKRLARAKLQRSIKRIKESEGPHYRDDTQADARILLAEYERVVDLLRRAVEALDKSVAMAGVYDSEVDATIAEIREVIEEDQP